MSFMSNREYSLMEISAALFRAKQGFLNCYELEDEQKVVKALVIDTLRAIRSLVDTCTEDYLDAKSISYLDGIENAVNDDVDRQFFDATTRRDDDLEEGRSDHGRMLNRADALYDARV
jgi:hypothetical protein